MVWPLQCARLGRGVLERVELAVRLSVVALRLQRAEAGLVNRRPGAEGRYQEARMEMDRLLLVALKLLARDVLTG